MPLLGKLTDALDNGTIGVVDVNSGAEELARYVRECEIPLRLIELTSEIIANALPHLADLRVNQWLDFGSGRQLTTAIGLQVLSRSPAHYLRAVMTCDGRLAGIGGLHHIDHPARNAMFWGLRVRCRPPLPSSAVVQTLAFMREAFNTLKLRSVYCWVAEPNRLSARVLQTIGFRLSGRHRLAHALAGGAVDRLLFDLVAEEFMERERQITTLLSCSA